MTSSFADRLTRLFARLSSAFDPIKLFPARHPILTLAAAAAITAVSAWQATYVVVDSSSQKIYEADDPEIPLYDDFRKEFGEDEIIVVSLRAAEGHDVFEKPFLEKVRKITDSIEALPS